MSSPKKITKNKKLLSAKKRKLFKSDAVNISWDLSERKRILRALREYGCSDFRKLADAVETKTPEQVKYFIERRKIMAQRNAYGANMGMKEAPIELWIDKAERALAQKPEYSTAMVEALKDFSQKEYGEVYQFFIHFFKSEMPPYVSPTSGTVIVRLLKDLAALIKSLDLQQIQKYMMEGCEVTDDGGSSEHSSSEELFQLYNEKFCSIRKEFLSINPLQLSPAILQKVYSDANEKMQEMFMQSEIYLKL